MRRAQPWTFLDRFLRRSVSPETEVVGAKRCSAAGRASNAGARASTFPRPLLGPRDPPVLSRERRSRRHRWADDRVRGSARRGGSQRLSASLEGAVRLLREGRQLSGLLPRPTAPTIVAARCPRPRRYSSVTGGAARRSVASTISTARRGTSSRTPRSGGQHREMTRVPADLLVTTRRDRQHIHARGICALAGDVVRLGELAERFVQRDVLLVHRPKQRLISASTELPLLVSALQHHKPPCDRPPARETKGVRDREPAWVRRSTKKGPRKRAALALTPYS